MGGAQDAFVPSVQGLGLKFFRWKDIIYSQFLKCLRDRNQVSWAWNKSSIRS